MKAVTFPHSCGIAAKLALSMTLLLFFSASAQASEMTISAAASLTNAFNELAAQFAKEKPDLQVYCNYAASNPLLQQIVEGAPVDIFASADKETMDKAVSAGVVDPSTRVDFAINELVLIVPKGAKKPESLSGLAKMDRIAIGEPASVPAGRYAKSVLKNARMHETLKDKLITGASVRQVLEYVAAGEVDAGFVYATDARQMSDRVDVAMILPTSVPVSYPIAVALTGKNPETGAEFIKFVMDEPGKKTLQKFGFAIPQKPE